MVTQDSSSPFPLTSVIISILLLIGFFVPTLFGLYKTDKAISSYEAADAVQQDAGKSKSVNGLREEFASARTTVISLSTVLSLLTIPGILLLQRKRYINPMRALSLFASRLAEGDLASASDMPKSNGTVEIAERFRKAFPCINNSATYEAHIARLKDHDMTCTDEMISSAGNGNGRGVCQAVGGFVEVVHSMRSDIESIQNALIETSNILGSVIGLTSDLGASTVGQVGELAQVAKTIEDNTSTINYIAQIGAQSRNSVETIVSDIADNASQIGILSGSMEEIQESTKRITSLITIIRDIADQTNLLALNAAIEAARAGEQGRGFAVVADEVRKLAEKVAKATQDVVDLINETESRVAKGVTVVKRVVGSNHEIEFQAKQIKEGIENLASAVEEQSASMEQLKGSSQKITAESENISGSTGELTETVLRMVESLEGASGTVNSYKIGG